MTPRSILTERFLICMKVFKPYDFHTLVSVTMTGKTKAIVCYLAQTKSNCISNGRPMMIIRGFNKEISVVVIHIKIKY